MSPVAEGNRPETAVNRGSPRARAIRARARPLRPSLEADETADERVVARVRAVGVVAPKLLVEAELGRRDRPRHWHTELAKTRRTDRDQQRGDRLDAALEVVEASPDEILPGQLAGLGTPIEPCHHAISVTRGAVGCLSRAGS